MRASIDAFTVEQRGLDGVPRYQGGALDPFNLRTPSGEVSRARNLEMPGASWTRQDRTEWSKRIALEAEF
jgi:hypothetical protein